MSDIYKRKKGSCTLSETHSHTSLEHCCISQSINPQCRKWLNVSLIHPNNHSLGLDVSLRNLILNLNVFSLFYLQSNHHEHAIWSPQEGLLLREL